MTGSRLTESPLTDDPSLRIARRAAREIRTGQVINLGIGIPLLIPQMLPPGVTCLVHQEAGYVGMGPRAEPGREDRTITDAAGNFVTLLPGAACFDSSVSFCIVRGGRLDCAFLGALEVDAQGSLANWTIPGRWSPGIGGGMELAQKARRVIVTMRHCDKNGAPKIVERCRLPLTAPRCVSLIVTELAVFKVAVDAIGAGRGLVLTELCGDASLEDVRAHTGAPFEVRLGGSDA
jgi:3-oxoacid CoA-transferase B subunit